LVLAWPEAEQERQPIFWKYIFRDIFSTFFSKLSRIPLGAEVLVVYAQPSEQGPGRREVASCCINDIYTPVKVL
jgi:hypothetical protein